VFETDADELHQIFRAYPDRQAALIDWRIGEIPDPYAGDANTVLMGVERTDRFAKRFAHAIAGIRTDRFVGADLALPRIKADRMVRRSEHDTLHLVPSRRLEQIVTADDIGVQDAIPRLLDRLAAEMDDAVHPVGNFFDLGKIGEIGLHESLMARQICRLSDVAPDECADRHHRAVYAAACRCRPTRPLPEPSACFTRLFAMTLPRPVARYLFPPQASHSAFGCRQGGAASPPVPHSPYRRGWRRGFPCARPGCA
jgi:hypothetical protein